MFDPQKIRKDFPQLRRKINGKPIIYLDSTATSLKPQSVINKMNEYYTRYTANVFRGIYTTSEEATSEFEKAREKIARFINAPSFQEIVFTRSTTESLNLVAAGLGKESTSSDNLVVSIMEHHSNFVPWQQRAFKKGITFKVWDMKQDGTLDMKDLDKLITRRTKLLAITAVSNVLGTINPIKEIVKKVKRLNAQCLIIVDAAQAVPHTSVDVHNWGADAVAFSGHKMLGPTGVGVLWAKMDLLQRLNPYQYGGEMISEVYVDRTVFKDPPHKFEAGTPHIAGVIGLGAAVDYLSKLHMKSVREHEVQITTYALSKLSHIQDIHVVGPKESNNRGGVIAFTMKGIHPHDIAQVLDQENVCVRVGFHCAQPLHDSLNRGPTTRASFYVYTTKDDIDALTAGLQKVKKLFS